MIIFFPVGSEKEQIFIFVVYFLGSRLFYQIFSSNGINLSVYAASNFNL